MLCNDISMNQPRFNTPVGSGVKTSYHAKILKDGNIELEAVGVIDVQAMIESERTNSELRTLIAKYENGDINALNARQGFYADVTKFPGSLIDAMNVVNDAQFEFDKLPVDIKKQYSNDWRKWLAQFGSDDWIKVMAPVFKPDVTEKESEVKNDAE